MHLTEAEYTATIAGRPRSVSVRHTAAQWRSYLAAMDAADWDGHDFGAGAVAAIYDMAGLHWRHVMIGCPEPLVQLALVINLRTGNVRGHYVLDLSRR